VNPGASRRPIRSFGRSLTSLRERGLRRAGVPLALLGAALLLGGCQVPTFGAFRGATVQGKDEFKLWAGMFIAGLVVAIFVWGLIGWAVVFYRRRNEDIPRQFHHHIPLEIIWTVTPLLMVLVIFYFTVITENEVDAVANRPNEVINVQAYRWGWRFTYENSAGKPQGVIIETSAEPKLLAQPATSKEYPQLVLPVNATIHINLSSLDVIHGFYVPAFNFSRYAQPGVTNEFDLTTTTTGIFPGQCTQYCGLYHAEMLFSVRVESQSSFDSWLSSEQASQGAA
jgi:cytochrome c oxidase subunit 2